MTYSGKLCLNGLNTPNGNWSGQELSTKLWTTVFSCASRPVSSHIFFEPVVRENLDIGRPKQVLLIFEKQETKRSPGTFRARVISDGVIPSLYVDYKGTRLKQYHKEGQALRTETTINNARTTSISAKALQSRRATANRLSGKPSTTGSREDLT
jgi:hypothetical protein